MDTDNPKGGGGAMFAIAFPFWRWGPPFLFACQLRNRTPFWKSEDLFSFFLSFLLDSQGGGPELESVCFFSFLLFKPPLLFPKSFVWASPGKICRFLSLVVWGLINCLHHASYRASSAKNNQKHANLLSRVIYINLFRSLSCTQFH